MARPALTHDGFLIPNAGDVANPRMAEPDRIDFNTLAHLRWGVIEDCLVTVSGTTAMTNGGVALVDGVLANVSSQSIPLGSGGAQDRFDLVVVDQGGTISVITGDYAPDPVFKDPPKDVTVLAAIFAPAGSTANYSDNVVDKRKFLPRNLLTKIAAGDTLIRNVNGSGDHFRVQGDGAMTWGDDTILSRVPSIGLDPGLRISGNLQVGGDLVDLYGTLHVGSQVIATSEISGSNFQRGDTLPAGNHQAGALFQNYSTGRIYIYQYGLTPGWKELATAESTMPVGSVIQSVETPDKMISKGWLPLNGTTYSEQTYPSLFTLQALLTYCTIEGIAPNRSMTLIDATDRVLITKRTGVGALSGTAGAPGRANNSVTLALANMPLHDHDVRVTPNTISPVSVTINRAGVHGHSMPQRSGRHGHNYNDPGHKHQGADEYLGGGFIVAALDGRNKIDAFFNDLNHTYSVKMSDWTRTAYTGITIGETGSEHTHDIDQAGDHDHPVTVNSGGTHGHDVSQQARGSGTPVDITPAYLAVYTYLRV